MARTRSTPTTDDTTTRGATLAEVESPVTDPGELSDDHPYVVALDVGYFGDPTTPTPADHTVTASAPEDE